MSLAGRTRCEARYISSGRAHGPLREVLKGLTPEDRVIVNGLMMLRPGVKVEVQAGRARSPDGKKATAEREPKPETKPQT